MPGALLRSGRLSEFRPLGAVGNPVYSSASQLRAAIRHQIGADVANLFAIPKQHDQGDVIDWYAPEDGDVVPWSAATPEQRAQAKAALVAAQAELAARSAELQAHEGSEQKVFGKLLAQAIRIPSDEHVYLVGDKPVVTFWGFVPLDAPSGVDVIAELDTGGRRVVPPPARVVVAPEPGRRLPWWLWLLLGLLLLLALLGLLWWLRGCGETRHHFAPLGAGIELEDERDKLVGAVTTSTLPGRGGIVVRDGRVVEGGGTGAVVPGEGEAGVEPGTDEPGAEDEAGDVPSDVPTTLPDDAAGPDEPNDEPTAETPTTVPGEPRTTPTSVPEPGTTPTSVPPEPGTTPTSVPTPPQPGTTPTSMPGTRPPETPLTIPRDAGATGSTDFLNGRWRSSTGLQDEAGNPVELEYDFAGGKGTVSVRRPGPDGRPVTCSGSAGSRMQNGKLVIDQGDIDCPGGGSFQAGTVECVAGQGGRAECEGRNEDGSDFDVRIVK